MTTNVVILCVAAVTHFNSQGDIFFFLIELIVIDVLINSQYLFFSDSTDSSLSGKE